MYLAPINYDRFFERVFRDDFIAKSLLEAILGVEITEMKRLPRKAKLKLQQVEKEAERRFLQQQLGLFKKLMERGESNESIQSFMEIDAIQFQNYLKLVEKNKK